MRIGDYIQKACKTLGLVFCFCVAVAPTARASISSISINAKTGEVIEARNADEVRAPASLTKIMTLYITFDALEKGTLKLDDKLKVSHHAANRAPSRIGLKPGSTITVRNAILALVVKSANDCSAVLAEHLGKTEAEFAKTMTQTAKDLGMKNTTFKNASGLPNVQQRSTARDMAVLGAAIYHHFPQYYHFFSTTEFKYQGQTYKSHNRMLKKFAGSDGMKTGYTRAAGYNIVTSAERDGYRVISVTMGHKTSAERDKKVHAMMDTGLTKLAGSSKVSDSNLYAALEEKHIRKVGASPVIVTSAVEEFEVAEVPDSAPSGSWGIQIGAFSNYAKARNYALQIQKEIPKKYSGKFIDIEAAQKGSAIVYRSKIIGFEKNEAQNACNDLKKSKKSCIVVAVNDSATSKMVVAQENTRRSNEQQN